MGSGRELKCPKCEYNFWERFGVGMLFPWEYARTVQDAREGKLGEEIQTFFAEHEEGAIRAAYVTLCCDKCGALKTGQDLTMFVPKDNKTVQSEHSRWSVAASFEGAKYVDDMDLDEFYNEYMKYPHKCDECGSSMHIVKGRESLKCPKCRTKLEVAGFINWD